MDSYNIYCEGRKIYSEVTRNAMFDIMDELSDQFYQQGVPNPDDIVVECVKPHEE